MLKQITRISTCIPRCSTSARYNTDESEQARDKYFGQSSSSDEFGPNSPNSPGRFDRSKKPNMNMEALERLKYESCPHLPNVFMGMAEKPLSEEIVALFQTEPKDSEIHVKRIDGGLFVHYSFFQDLLNKAFGVCGWAVIPISKPTLYRNQDNNWIIMREYGLYGQARFLSMGLGEGLCYPYNQVRSGLVSSMDICKRDALTLCCREIGIAANLHNEEFVAAWRERFAQKVMCENVLTRVNRFLWKRKDNENAFSYPWRPTSNYANYA